MGGIVLAAMFKAERSGDKLQEQTNQGKRLKNTSSAIPVGYPRLQVLVQVTKNVKQLLLESLASHAPGVVKCRA